jgi:cell shape-determining protein MreD
LLSAAPTGASVLGMLLLVFAIYLIHRQVYGISLVVLAGLVLAGTLIQQLTMMLILGTVGFNVSPFDGITYITVPTMAYNLALIWPIYWLARRLQKRYTRDGRVLV